MIQKTRTSKHILYAGAFVALLTFSLTALEKVPELKLGRGSSAEMLSWAGNAIQEIETNSQVSRKSLEVIQTFISFMEELRPEQIEKNLEHFDYLQKLKDKEFEAQYWLGVHHIKERTWTKSQVKAHLEILRVRNSTAEYELIYLKELEAWSEFYRKSREVLELYEAYPSKLGLKAPIPPTFPSFEGLPLNTLHDLMIIIDISLKHHWVPEKTSYFETLRSISQGYEAKQAHRLAYETLELVDPLVRSKAQQVKINQLKVKASQLLKKVTTEKALY